MAAHARNNSPSHEPHNGHYETHQAAHSPLQKTHGDNYPHIGYLDNIQSEHLVDAWGKSGYYFDRADNNSLLVAQWAYSAIGLTLFAVYLAASLAFVPERTGELLSLKDMFTGGMVYYHVMLAVTLLGISGGFYIVPLYAMMQAYSPRSHRARVVAANNILNAVFMVSSAIFSILILSILKIDIKILFIITAILSAIFSFWLLKRLKPLLADTSNTLED